MSEPPRSETTDPALEAARATVIWFYRSGWYRGYCWGAGMVLLGNLIALVLGAYK